MSKKDLSKMSREELLEILLIQRKKIAQLEEELQNTHNELNKHHFTIQQAGSIAEASLNVSGIFESAQKAANIYLENIAELKQQQIQAYENTVRRCSEKEQQVYTYLDRLIRQTEQECEVRKNQLERHWIEKIQNLTKEVGNER